MIVLAVFIAFVLAMNIGALNSVAEMSAAYGAGVRSKSQAVTLIAIFALLGAVLMGHEVMKTLGRGIIPEYLFTRHEVNVFVVLIMTTAFLIWANLVKTPIATTHAIVCSIVGVGLAYGEVHVGKFLQIVAWWIVTPALSFIVNYAVNRYGYVRILHALRHLGPEERMRRVLAFLLTATGCYVAFSAGANNSANSFGALVGAGVVSPTEGALFAGLGMGLGAICFGGRILETMGKEITEIGIVRAIILEFVGATLIFVASWAGIPISLNETVTAGILALSCVQSGFRSTARNRHVVRIALVWILGPFLAVGLSYGVAQACRTWVVG